MIPSLPVSTLYGTIIMTLIMSLDLMDKTGTAVNKVKTLLKS